MTDIFAVYGFGYAQTAAFDHTGKRAKRIAQAAAHIHFVAAADQSSSSQLMPLTMTVASCFWTYRDTCNLGTAVRNRGVFLLRHRRIRSASSQ
ncbi:MULTISPECIES: hypothetical protein [unclassified Eikenella]|uniref:hypothetical protein n=1 Tax=unclassified Eikenella TaxID=2639367 RepID=UPI000A7B27FB|nr:MULTISPECIES: hypothetical protein [unclassified Eikenella]